MSPTYLFILFIVLIASNYVLGDLYVQNPRGNNDRLNENGDRNNGNRLFDSQNNARGGYCYGPELAYYEGSVLSVEWTAQHSCGNDNTRCNFVIQYMCSDDSEGADPTQIIRDGTTTTTIPNNANPAAGTNYYNAKDANGIKYLYGMNEPIAYYQACAARSRNKGLFAADQNLDQNGKATVTRQNAGATRYGFECPEESEYYPYWHPSPWKDVAVLTNENNCALYQSQSQNVLGKNFCNGTTDAAKAANNERDCAQATGGTWVTVPPYNLPAPECLPAPVGRDNHLGNGAVVDGVATTNSFNWTLPTGKTEACINDGSCACVMRMRYNITVGEVPTDLDSRNNTAANSPVTKDPIVRVEGTELELALDTAQTGRTFQDRTFMFRIIPRDDKVPAGAKIYNLNVRGKRGNIVQTYPATEYDFVPTHLEVAQDDYVHFQWTGCDTNPAGNAGEGTTSTDRSNIVQIASMTANYPLTDAQLKTENLLFTDPAVRARLANIDQTNCLNSTQLKAKFPNDANAREQDPQNCGKLNAAKTPKFDGGVVKMSNLGTFYYMSTRNNNFSNRSQKASITVSNEWPAWKTAAIVVGGVAAVAIGAAAGTIFYARRNPHSRVAEFVHKVPGLSKI